MKIRSWRYRRLHISYLVGWLALGILLGIYGARYVSVGLSAFWLMTALVLGLGGFRSGRWWSVGALVAAGLLLGCMRGTAAEDALRAYMPLLDTKQLVSGVISDDVELINDERQRFVIKNVTIDGASLPGLLFVTLHSKTSLQRGDSVAVQGTLRSGFATYPAVLSAARLVEKVDSTDPVGMVRERFGAALRAVVVEPLASLGLGFVVGQRSALPDTLDEQLRVVGLTHIVVASGYNLTILVRFVMRLLSRHSRYLALSLSLSAVLAFVLLSGFSPSMNRAMIVTVLGLFAWYVGRRFNPLLLIVLVATGTAFWNPSYLWSDLGWYLSFFAFAGILVVAPLLIATLYRGRQPTPLEQVVVETVSAELMVLPLLALTFGELPVLGLVANVLVAPLIPLAMALTALTGLVGMISLSMGALLALPTMIVIGYIVSVVEWLAALPFALQQVQLSLPMLLGWYLLLAIVCAVIVIRLRYDFHARDRRLEV